MLIGVDFTGPSLRAGLVEQGVVRSSLTAEVSMDSRPPEILDTLAGLVRALVSKP